jgi:hypothetical protein
MRFLAAASLLALGASTLAHADVGMKIVTPKGYVAFTVGDDWKVVQLQGKTPVATAVYQLPNPGDEKTSESTNIVLVLYDLATDRGRRRFNIPLPTYGANKPIESTLNGWTVFVQSGIQNDIEYTILDARREKVGDVAATVRVAWPHLPGNANGYDEKMEKTFRAFLASIQGHEGTWTPGKDEVLHRPEGTAKDPAKEH